MISVRIAPRSELGKALMQRGAMAIHVHELHMAHGEGARRCIIKNIKLEHAKAKIQLFP